MRVTLRQQLSDDVKSSINLHLRNFSAGAARQDDIGDQVSIVFELPAAAQLFAKSFAYAVHDVSEAPIATQPASPSRPAENGLRDAAT